jgi:hypothetical protein
VADLPDWLMRREKPHTSGGLMLEAGGWIRPFFLPFKGALISSF